MWYSLETAKRVEWLWIVTAGALVGPLRGFNQWCDVIEVGSMAYWRTSGRFRVFLDILQWMKCMNSAIHSLLFPKRTLTNTCPRSCPVCKCPPLWLLKNMRTARWVDEPDKIQWCRRVFASGSLATVAACEYSMHAPRESQFANLNLGRKSQCEVNCLPWIRPRGGLGFLGSWLAATLWLLIQVSYLDICTISLPYSTVRLFKWERLTANLWIRAQRSYAQDT